MSDYSNEIWKDCPHYEGLYQISSFGRIWSIKSQKYLKAVPRREYLAVNLYNSHGKQRTESVHRLVCLAFHGEAPEGKTQVNHKDGCKTNNCANNLEWVDNSENILHAYYVLNKKVKQVRCIETGIIYQSTQQASKELNICNHIYAVCNGKRKTCGGFHWEYAERERKEPDGE